MKTCQAQLKAVTRNAESLTETASVFKVSRCETSESHQWCGRCPNMREIYLGTVHLNGYHP
eukprot:409735-Amorphochlora_amoeboformis.AAC.3